MSETIAAPESLSPGDLALKILSEKKIEIDEACSVAGDDGDTGLYLYMTISDHVTSLGYAWAVASDIIKRDPVDERHWFRRIEIRAAGNGGEVLVGSATVRFEDGGVARALVAAALMDWQRRCAWVARMADEALK